MIKIDKGVPLPERKKGPTPRYPLAELEVGDSFGVEAQDLIDQQRVRSSLYGAIRTVGRRTGHEFVMRTVTGGIRVWRVK